MGSSSADKLSVLVLASDLCIDARPFLNHSDSETQEEEPWRDCPPYLDEDFSDLEALQLFRLEPASSLWFLTGGLYWKIKYVSRLHSLWEDIKKGDVEIPEFVQEHDDILEHRPLTDYGIEPDPLHLTDIPTTGYPFGRYPAGWPSREYMS